MRRLPDFENRGNYSKDDFNRLKDEVARLGRLSAQQPLELINNSSGPTLRFIDQCFWAVLIACGSSSSGSSSCGQQACPYGPKYCWLEVQPDGTGGWLVKPGGRATTITNGAPTNPAYEVNGACVQTGAVVRMYPGLSSDFLFDHCCAFTPPFIACSSSSSSSSPSSSVYPVSSSSSSSSSSSGVSSSSTSSSTTSSLGSSTGGGTLCVPFVAMVSCGGGGSSAGGSAGGSSAGGGTSSGTLVVTMNYLSIPAGLGITVSSTPCTG